MAWLHDRSIHGPDRAGVRDIESLNRIFAEAFTDRYRRDGMIGVRVPFLNPAIWRYAIEDAGEGAFIWRDADGRPAAFNMVHQSGREGWMGPLAVRPDRQNEGLGKTVVQAGIDWLRARGASTVGLETMPRTVDNIGFYSRLGFVPRYLTVTLVREVTRRPVPLVELLSRAGEARALALAQCRELSLRLGDGVDFTREIQLTGELGVGDTCLIRENGRLTGFAVWHTAALAEGRPRDELRVLKLVAEDAAALDGLFAAVDASAVREGVRRVSYRAQTADAAGYARLVAAGCRVHWTDLRMTLDIADEPTLHRGLIWSNWEI